MQQIPILIQTKSAANVEHFSILNQMLVHQIDSRWRHILLSLITMYGKLVILGFVYYNKEIQIIESVEKQKYVYPSKYETAMTES